MAPVGCFRILLLVLWTSQVTVTMTTGLIFTQKELEKTITWDYPPNTDFLHLYIMLPPCSDQLINEVTCYVEVTWTNCSTGGADLLEYPFGINQSSKAVYWERHFTENEVKDFGKQCDFHLSIKCLSSNETDLVHTKASLKVISGDPVNSNQCVTGNHPSFQVYENTKDVVIGNVAPLPPALSTGRKYVYTIHSAGDNTKYISEDQLVVNNHTGDIILHQYFDREMLSKTELLFSVKCHSYICDTSGSCHDDHETSPNSTQFVTVDVLDVNDNGPVIGKRKKNGEQVYLKSQERTSSGWMEMLSFDKSFVVIDKDTDDVNQYEIHMVGNEKGVFELGTSMSVFPIPPDTYYSTKVSSVTNASLIPAVSEMAFDLVFNDVSLCHINAETETPKVIFTQKFKMPAITAEETPTSHKPPPLPDVYYLKADKPVYTADPMYTRVIALRKNLAQPLLHNFSVQPGGIFPHIFNVTHRDGIIYVSNTAVLRSADNMVHNLTLKARLERPPAKYVTTVVEIEIISKGNVKAAFSRSCSFHKTQQECRKYSAPGARQCAWRHNVNSGDFSGTYETCVPDLAHCPDGHCDEIEQLKPSLCPQDCTVEVNGAGRLNRKVNPPRGIIQGQSPCWCSEDLSCTCMKVSNIRATTDFITILSETNIKTSDVTTSEFNPPAMQKTPNTVCNTSCKMSILGAFLSVLLMVVAATLSCRLFRKKAQSVKLKHIASNVSLSAVTSDYHDDTEVHEEMSDNRYAPIGVNLKLKADPKWEIGRSNIILEKVLGEGEFGKVLKAKVLDLPGTKGYSTAAVKTLKEQATIAEFRDLLSEYNLLKDVNHRNVIKLLGACTIKGPFMMIVEYCQYGSLKNYLQNCRCQGEVTETGCVIYKQHNSLGTLVPVTESQAETPIGSPRHSNISTEKTIIPGINDAIEGLTVDDVIAVLTGKDLISFAWQIANGMQYLNEMKVVHRDLAARNILVGASKCVKISDFGLSRDIYEEDHYMKKSKGRVPVKWMAPESLYDHVYTSRSDVWSFGVVLWEIVTMGATPYPGVLPERLYTILQNGYRMSKPPGCSNNIFDVMSKCWQFEAMSRPGFKELSNIFEKMLKDKSDYLDLNSICNEEFGSSEDEGMDNFNTRINLNNDTRNDNSAFESLNIQSGDQEEHVIKSKSNYLIPSQGVGNRHLPPNMNFGHLQQQQHNGEEFGRKSKHAFNPLYSSDAVNTPYDSPDSRQSRRALVEANNAQNGALLVPPDLNSNLDQNVHRSCPSLNGALPNGQAPKGMICIFRNGKVKSKATKNRRGNESGTGTKPLVYADLGSSPTVSEDIETEI